MTTWYHTIGLKVDDAIHEQRGLDHRTVVILTEVVYTHFEVSGFCFQGAVDILGFLIFFLIS